MVKDTNAKQSPGEASRSRRPKRQRLPSIVEAGAEEGDNGGGTSSVDGDLVMPDVRSGTLCELDLLDCPICYNALTIPIYQCDNGHIACSSCCNQMRNKCPSCIFPIGTYRCRIMERIVEAVIVPCPNAKHGCTEKFSYGKELLHEKKCSFALCYCPAPNCNYTGGYKDISCHYEANHKVTWNQFVCGYSDVARVSHESILVLQEYGEGPLVVVQCFKLPEGSCVTVNCIAPCAPGVGNFSCKLSCEMGDNTLTHEWRKVNRIQKVRFQIPEKDFMPIPSYGEKYIFKNMRICINRLEEE